MIMTNSFRPLAGIMVLIFRRLKSGEDVITLMFPSPCGDYGSYLDRLKEITDDWFDKFPSPCGDYGSYQRLALVY